MKFNLEETVTGADLRPGAALLVFPRDRLTEVLKILGKDGVSVDAFVVDRQRVTAAVFFPEQTDPSEELLGNGVVSEGGFFRLILRGRRLAEGKGLAALWESVLAQEKIPLRLSCSDCAGITQYLPLSARPAVLELLDRTFGVKEV